MKKLKRAAKLAGGAISRGWQKAKTWKGLGSAIHAVVGDGAMAATAEVIARDVFRRDSCGCAMRHNRLDSLVPFNPPTLVLGIPHQNDLEGLWATLMDIRKSVLLAPNLRWWWRSIPLKDLVQVVVINQKKEITTNGAQVINPATVAEKLEGYAVAMTRSGLRVTVEHQPTPHGSARAKQGCADAAAKLGADWLMILDCHIEFVDNLTIWRFMNRIKHQRNRNDRSLFYGFLINDHMFPQMRGGKLTDANGYISLQSFDTQTGLPIVGGDNLWGRWSDPVIYVHGLATIFREDADLIPQHMLSGGWFVPLALPKVRRKIERAIGGAKINGPFPTAGDLIAYMQRQMAVVDGKPAAWKPEKRRQVLEGLIDLATNVWPDKFEIESCGGWLLASRVDQCIPSLDALNHAAVHPKLYFDEMEGFGGEESIVAFARRENGYKVYCLPMLAAWHRFMRTRPPVYGASWQQALKNHVRAAMKLTKSFGESLRRNPQCKNPAELFAAAYVAGGRPADEVAKVMAELGYGTPPIAPPKLAPPKTVATTPTPTAPPKTIGEAYKQACETKSDINEHLPTLFKLAMECPRITEFGSRGGTSTKAFLAAIPDVMSAYDINPQCGCKSLAPLVDPRTKFEMHFGPEFNTAVMPQIAQTDLLFIDSLHTEAHVFAELARHSVAVEKYIVLHDTEAPWGNKDEGGGTGGGVNAAIAKFLEQSAEWEIGERYTNNHGLVILTRKPSAGGQ